MDTRRAWLRFGLTVGACVIGGFGTGVLIAAVIVKRIAEGVVNPAGPPCVSG